MLCNIFSRTNQRKKLYFYLEGLDHYKNLNHKILVSHLWIGPSLKSPWRSTFTLVLK